MDVREVGSLFIEAGFSKEVEKAFCDDDMDGEAICVAFGTVSGPDCLSSVIKTLGTRLKVYKFLKDIFDAEFQTSPTLSMASSPLELYQNWQTPSPQSCTPVESVKSEPSVISSPKQAIKKPPVTLFSKTIDKVPDPFPIPQFCDETQKNLDIGKFTEQDKNYMVRTLATMLCTFVTRPKTADCEIPAKALVAKYPFLKSVVSFVIY
uniref:Uncharacterized protein n=1 Tax=Amphimedon queenslandica TaxID=400682 RepID=A0A1X7SLK8_AMPQE